MLAQKASVLSNIKENTDKKNRKIIFPYYLTPDMVCYKGHDKNLYNRADGECGRCHYERNLRYRRSKGRAIYTYMQMRSKLKGRIKKKVLKIATLEKELLKYDKENSNRTRAR